MKRRCERDLASLEELANNGKPTRIVDIMNINMFSLLGGFSDFGCLFAVEYYRERVCGEFF